MIGSTVETIDKRRRCGSCGEEWVDPVDWPGVFVVVRATCLADGSPAIAYDFVPVDAQSGDEVRTVYRPIPAVEGECGC